MMDAIQEICGILDELDENPSIPQNVKRDAKTIFELMGDNALSVENKKSQAEDLLETMVNDPNIESSVRTTLLTVTSLIESLSESRGSKDL